MSHVCLHSLHFGSSKSLSHKGTTPWKINMTMDQNKRFEDVSPIKNDDFTAITMLVFRGCTI